MLFGSAKLPVSQQSLNCLYLLRFNRFQNDIIMEGIFYLHIPFYTYCCSVQNKRPSDVLTGTPDNGSNIYPLFGLHVQQLRPEWGTAMTRQIGIS